MAEMSAVNSRIDELLSNIDKADKVLSVLDAQLRDGQHSLKEKAQQLQEKHDFALRRANQLFIEEFDANASLTLHFTSSAHDACIQTLLKQQDILLEPEYIAVREELLKLADMELERREESFARTEKAKLQEVLQKEESVYLKRVERAVIAHEERLRRIDSHDELY